MFMWCVSTLRRRRAVRVVDDDVGIRARCDHALARIQPEHARRRRRAQLDPARERELAVDDALVDEIHPVLDPADAVGDRREVAEPQLLLLLHAERAVVGAHHREIVGAQVAPQLVLMALRTRTQRRRAHVLRAFEAGRAQVLFEREVEVLRAGLTEDVPALVARRARPRRLPASPTCARRTAARPRAWPA